MVSPAPSLIRRFARDRRGATAIEYALIITFIAIVIVGGATRIGTGLGGIFNNTSAGFSGS